MYIYRQLLGVVFPRQTVQTQKPCGAFRLINYYGTDPVAPYEFPSDD